MLCLLGKPKFPYSCRAPEGQCLQVQLGGVGKTDITSGTWRVFPVRGGLEVGHARSPKYSMGDGNLGELERRRKGIKQMESSKGAGRGFGAVPAAPRVT